MVARAVKKAIKARATVAVAHLMINNSHLPEIKNTSTGRDCVRKSFSLVIYNQPNGDREINFSLSLLCIVENLLFIVLKYIK